MLVSISVLHNDLNQSHSPYSPHEVISLLVRDTVIENETDDVPAITADENTLRHSVMIRSAHSTSETKVAGVPNFAPHSFMSVSATPRAREQAPHEKT